MFAKRSKILGMGGRVEFGGLMVVMHTGLAEA